MRILVVAAVMGAFCCGPASPAGEIPVYGYEIVKTYPHDPKAYTQGLFYLNGFLYEGTGEWGESSIRKVRFETGEVLQKRDVPEAYFGEGIVNWKDRLIEITWQTQIGFVYDLNSFAPRREFRYKGEGWGITQDGKRLIMSDGVTPRLRFFDPETLQETGSVTVMAGAEPVMNLNELEWVKGEIFANIWQTDRIARIDPANGRVVGWIDATGLQQIAGASGEDNVLNGIAYDSRTGRLWLTGKRWSKLFEVRLVKK